MKLEKENVRIILIEMLNDIEYWADDNNGKTLCYIAGLTDMATAVIKAIGELGGK